MSTQTTNTQKAIVENIKHFYGPVWCVRLLKIFFKVNFFLKNFVFRNSYADIPSDAVTNDTNSNKSSSTSGSDDKIAGRSTLQTRSDDELRRIRIERQRERDPISYAIGEFGRWQFQWTVLLALFNLPCTWHIFVMTFQNDAGGPFWCARPDNLKNLSISEWVNISGITERSSSVSGKMSAIILNVHIFYTKKKSWEKVLLFVVFLWQVVYKIIIRITVLSAISK